MGRSQMPLRFWEKVEVGGNDECWLWVAGKFMYGYGQFYMDGRKIVAHRASYILTFGPIPTGMVIDHLCHNPNCVNPYHLRACTQAENVRNQKRRNNSSGIKGVGWHKNAKKWRAYILVDGKQKSLGYFDSIEDAQLKTEAALLERDGVWANFG